MTTVAEDQTRSLEARRITLCGSVQGRGIRPIVARVARSSGIAGSVRNEMSGVIIIACGSADDIDQFLKLLRRELPPAAKLAGIEPIDDDRAQADQPFQILDSSQTGPTRTVVPVDRATCQACLREVVTRSDRRFAYPFISCTLCGPRYSILSSMPYDRSRTSMASYPMCRDCRQEYQDPQSRRFHSQTNCCPACGPRLWSTDAMGDRVRLDQHAIEAAVAAIRDGGIVAMKGIGGYQLICDAANEAAVVRLRERKRRLTKPLAIMAADLDAAERLTELSPVEREALAGAAGPIVIARSRPAGSLARSVNAGFCDLGIMLPTTALHFLLLRSVGIPLVVTSGNVGDHPLEYRESDATRSLAAVADLFLHHDRQIIRPIDDSVVRCMHGRSATIRAGRGLAPVTLDQAIGRPAIALGAQQKAAVAISNGHQAVLGPHIGDLDSVASRQRFADQAQSLCRLYRCDPDRFVHDRHPDYWTTQYAEQRVGRSTQHHHAHVVAAMAQHDWLERTVLGFAFDGTGLGTDNTLWGGECLLASAGRFERVGHLRPFPLAGGEAAIRDPVRSAIALIRDACGEAASSALDLINVDDERRQAISSLLDSSFEHPVCSSVGRLFDAVAAMIWKAPAWSFEGEPAMRLEAACDDSDSISYRLPLTDDSPLQLDWRPLILQLLADKRKGIAGGKIAMRFHRGLAAAVVDISERFPDHPIALTGGVFQNRRLVELIAAAIPAGRELGLPGSVPPNDGGLAIGQLAVAAATDQPARSRACV